MNSQLSVLMLEDDAAWSIQIETLLLRLGFHVSLIANNTANLITQLPNINFDIALLDISVDGYLVGIELGKIIKQQYNKPVIFLTANTEASIKLKAEAIQAHILYKPVEEKQLYQAIQTSINELIETNEPIKSVNTKSNDFIFIKVGNKYKKILWKEVELLEIDGKYTAIKVHNNTNNYYIRSSLQKMLQVIIPAEFQALFIQINRNQILNSQFIEELNGNILLSNGSTYEYSENYLNEIKAKLNILR
jgi:two-component system, LytTR family, response regulator LytT